MHSTCPQDCYLGKHLLWEKNTFQIIFRILDGNLPGFRYCFSSTVTRTALVSRFLIGFLPIISDFTQNSLGWSVGTTLYLTTRLFSWEAPFLKKNTFQIIFRILDGDFSGFRRKISSTVVRTALVSRIFHRNYARFFRTSRKIFWLVCQNCTLRVHGIVFMGSIFFEKITFPIVFYILEGAFSGVWANLFQHGSQNCIGFFVSY